MASDAVNIKELFLALADLPSNERAIRLADVDAPTRQRVEALLRSHDEAGSESPAPDGPRTDAFVATGLESCDGEQIGQHVGPYKLLEKLGEGGMGTVWAAEQLEPIKRRVALKLIKAGMDSTKILRRFEAERQALAMMDHANIAKVLDAGQIPPVAPGGLAGRPFFVMELIHGINITKYCDQEHLTPRERLELFIPVCQAVQHAHQKGIIHRDLKPSNVLVGLYDGRPVPKVIDFGVAKATQQALIDGTIHTEVGQIVGTLEYMSPEQAELNNLDIDTRSDIYSLGVILYELLAGTPPFTRKQLQSAAFSEMLRVIREVEPQKPSTRLSSSDELPSIAANRHLDPKRLTKTVSGDLDWIVMKCLEKERGRRYETANALATDIQRHLADEPVLAGPPSATYRLKKFVRRNRGAVIAAGLVTASLLAGMAGTAWQAHSARLARIDAEEQTKQARDEKQIAYEERKKAEQENAIAQAISDFLRKDLLEQADIGNQPGGGRNPNITVRELLDRASKRIEGRFPNQGATEAAIRLTLSNSYKALSEFGEAQKHLERALELRMTALGPRHADTLVCMNNLAGMHHTLGRLAQAEPMYRQVLAARIDILGPEHAQTLNCMNNLAICLHDLGRLDEATPFYRNVLAARTRTLGKENASTLNSMNGLAYHLQELGEYDESKALYQAAIQIGGKTLKEDHPQLLLMRHNYGLLLQWLDEYDECEKTLNDVLRIRKQVLGPDHAETIRTIVVLGQLYSELARYAEADPLLRQAADTLRRKYGELNAQYLSAANHLAICLSRSGNHTESEALCRAMIAARLKLSGPEHHDTLRYHNNLAILLQKIGRLDEAEALIRQVRGDRYRIFPNNRKDLALSDWQLASVLLAQKKYDEAVTVIQELKRNDHRAKRIAWPALETDSMLGEALLGLGETAEAEPLIVGGYEGLKRFEQKIVPCERSSVMAGAVKRLIVLAEAQNKSEEAAKWKKELEALRLPSAKP